MIYVVIFMLIKCVYINNGNKIGERHMDCEDVFERGRTIFIC